MNKVLETLKANPKWIVENSTSSIGRVIEFDIVNEKVIEFSASSEDVFIIAAVQIGFHHNIIEVKEVDEECIKGELQGNGDFWQGNSHAVEICLKDASCINFKILPDRATKPKEFTLIPAK